MSIAYIHSQQYLFLFKFNRIIYLYIASLVQSSFFLLFLLVCRIRENLCNTLTRKFIDEMKLYQNAQQKYKNDIKKKVKRQVQIVQPDATDEEIDAVIRSEGGREALYKEKILAGRVADPIK